MKEMKMIEKFDSAKNIPEIFEVVRETVKDTFSVSKSGLTVSLNNLDTTNRGILGAVYLPQDSLIVVNKKILNFIKKKKPELMKSYLFHVLLHEYLHSVGFIDEAEVRKLAFLISNKHFGSNHDVTRLAGNIDRFIKNFVDMKEVKQVIEKINEDRSVLNYIG